MQFFICPKIHGRLTLSTESCASQYRAAQSREWAYRLPHCAGCEIGAKNAGVDLSAPFQRRVVCVRCGSSEGRMVLAGRFCMTCYNREREWRIGKNGKGAPPRQYKPLVSFLFTCISTGRRYLIDATSAVEARLSAQKCWGLTDLVLDRRMSILSHQLTIFEEGRATHAPSARCS